MKLRAGRRLGARSLVAGVVMMLVTVFGIGPAMAYNLEGARWDNTPTSGCCATIHVQYSSAWYPGDSAAVDNARGAWNASPANVWLDNHSGALTADDTYNSSVGWDGITYWGTHGCGFLWWGTCFSYANVYLNYYYTRNYSSSSTQGVAAHELGHAIGLAHTNGCVLMTPNTGDRNNCGIYGPVSDDVNGINSLY